SIRFSVCDTGDPLQVKAAWETMRQAGFLPDVAILNAGINIHDLTPQFDHAAFRKQYETNLFGATQWVDLLLPGFLQRGSGHFVAISSMSAYLRANHGAGYASSKAAMSMAFGCLEARYGKDGIGFTTVNLGPTQTAMWPGGKFPLLMSAESAAAKILKAVEKKKSVLDLPCLLVLLARLTQFIPQGLLSALVSLVKPKKK
ncbi:MAG: SDR family NAD(P)-dependent oxidoreductase, partial [Elusimicrobiota bacterium]